MSMKIGEEIIGENIFSKIKRFKWRCKGEVSKVDQPNQISKGKIPQKIWKVLLWKSIYGLELNI